MPTRAGDRTVTPAASVWTQFEVTSLDGAVQILASKGDLTVDDGTGTTTLAQGQRPPTSRRRRRRKLVERFPLQVAASSTPPCLLERESPPRHYEIRGMTAKRVEPIALRPREFVDEWLAQPVDCQPEVVGHIIVGSTQAEHENIHGGVLAADSIFAPCTCGQSDCARVFGKCGLLNTIKLTR